jgi:c-di-GMP-binding flagellar brake protein YcgR
MSQRKVSSWGQFLGLRDNEDVTPPPGTERRLFGRHECSLPAVCETTNLPETVNLEGQVRNLSREGIGLLLARQIEIAAVLKVELQAADQSSATIMLACVVYTQKEQEGAWMHGCAFVTELSDAEMAQFGAERVRPATAEQRSWVRFPCDLEASYRLVRVTERNMTHAKVVDISASGVGLVVQRPIDAGSLLSIVLLAPKGKSSLKMLACVVRVTERPGDELLLGCNFIRELNDRELVALLPKL